MEKYIEINNKKYSRNILTLLTGKSDIDENLPEIVLLIAESLENPPRLPFLIEDIYFQKIDDPDRFRLTLIRVQIDADLHMNKDLKLYQQRKYVAQVIEKLIYGEILLEQGMENGSEADEDLE